MPRFIIKMEKDGEERYLEWSTVVDAPVTYGMTYVKFLKYYRDQYGARGMDGLFGEYGRMQRVHAHGTSAHMDDSVHETIVHNRAGDKGSALDFDGIWQQYVVGRPKGDEEEQGPEDFHQVCAMFCRAGIEFRETLGAPERTLDLSMGSTFVRFVFGPDGRLRRVECPQVIPGL